MVPSSEPLLLERKGWDGMGSRSRAPPGLALVTGELLGWGTGKRNLKNSLKNRFWSNVGRLAVSHCEKLGYFRLLFLAMLQVIILGY